MNIIKERLIQQHIGKNPIQVFTREGSRSHSWETSVIISDDYGRIKYRIDFSEHAMPSDHSFMFGKLILLEQIIMILILDYPCSILILYGIRGKKSHHL